MKVKRTCPVCGVEYDADPKRLEFGRQTTCSRSCSYKARAAGLRNGEWFACAVCGKQFYKSPAQVKAKHGGQFCSRACHYRGRSLGISKRVVTKPYVYSEATREQMSETAVRMAVFGGQVPKFEDEVAETLDRLGVAYKRQFPIHDSERRRWYACDFFLPDLGMVVEVNCGGNHVDPRIKPRSTRGQKRLAAIERDEARRAAVVRSGYVFRELWETDLRESVEDAVRLAVGV